MGDRRRLYPKLGDLVVRAADKIVWLDLPIRIWLPRLIRRTARRLLTCEELWNGNRESLRSVIEGASQSVVAVRRKPGQTGSPVVSCSRLNMRR